MNEIVNSDSNQNNDENEYSISPKDEQKSKVQGIFQSLEMMVHKREKGGLDISSFSTEQKDKLLDILSKNEDNAFEYQTKKLEASKDVELARINSKTVSQRTNRFVSLGLIGVLLVVTVIILLFKDEYFVQWLAFITGSFGGYGIGRYGKDSEKTERPKMDDEDDD